MSLFSQTIFNIHMDGYEYVNSNNSSYFLFDNPISIKISRASWGREKTKIGGLPPCPTVATALHMKFRIFNNPK